MKLQFQKRAIFIGLAFILIQIDSPLKAQGCSPNDPNGSNPGTLCFTLPLTIFPSNMIQTGYAKSGYYGSAVSPKQPGEKLINQPIQGEFFTSVSAEQGVGIQIKTNSGRSWSIEETVENSVIAP